MRQTMLLYARTDQWAAALQAFEAGKARLYKAMGLPSAAETITLYEAIKAKQLSPTAVQARAYAARVVQSMPLPTFLAEPPPAPPIFVGRERELDVLDAALEEALGDAQESRPQKSGAQLRFIVGGAGQARLDRATAIAPQAAPWLTQLTRLVTQDVAPSLRQQDIFSQTTAFLQAVADQQPLLLILEDLHWADPASCSLLFHLSRTLDPTPILLIGTYRPEEMTFRWDGERHPLASIVDELKRQHGDIWLDLGTMSEDKGRRFVAAYLDSQPNRLDEDFREALFRQTGAPPCSRRSWSTICRRATTYTGMRIAFGWPRTWWIGRRCRPGSRA